MLELNSSVGRMEVMNTFLTMAGWLAILYYLKCFYYYSTRLRKNCNLHIKIMLSL